jgi:hypothetical protein
MGHTETAVSPPTHQDIKPEHKANLTTGVRLPWLDDGKQRQELQTLAWEILHNAVQLVPERLHHIFLSRVIAELLDSDDPSMLIRAMESIVLAARDTVGAQQLRMIEEAAFQVEYRCDGRGRFAVLCRAHLNLLSTHLPVRLTGELLPVGHCAECRKGEQHAT